ncbi:MAG: GvpL/GvpF family gas vesicle protein [Actinomycetes bacterium]
MSLHLYGVVRHGHPVPPDLVGVRSGGVRLVESDAVAAVTTDVPDDIEVTEDDAERHLEVLTALVADGPVLPLRLGTVAPDEDAVRAEVLDALDDLPEQLDALDGLIEVHVDVGDDEDTRLRAVLEEDPALRARAGTSAASDLEERVGLGEAVAARLAEHRAVDGDAVAEWLAPIAVASTLRGEDDGWVLRAAYLIREVDLRRFDEALERLHAEYGGALSFSRVGPLPVFSFAVDSGRGGSSRWGW